MIGEDAIPDAVGLRWPIGEPIVKVNGVPIPVTCSRSPSRIRTSKTAMWAQTRMPSLRMLRRSNSYASNSRASSGIGRGRNWRSRSSCHSCGRPFRQYRLWLQARCVILDAHATMPTCTSSKGEAHGTPLALGFPMASKEHFQWLSPVSFFQRYASAP